MKGLWAFPALFLLIGCLGGDHLTSWDGRPEADLIFAWGPPDKADTLPDGRRVLAYGHTHLFDGTSYDCDALFRVSAAGVIQSTTASGNIGGCNRLLLSKPAAK